MNTLGFRTRRNIGREEARNDAGHIRRTRLLETEMWYSYGLSRCVMVTADCQVSLHENKLLLVYIRRQGGGDDFRGTWPE